MDRRHSIIRSMARRVGQVGRAAWGRPGAGTLVLLSVLASGCVEAPASPTTSAPFTQTDIRIGTGDAAASGQVLQVDYTGWLYDASRPDQKGLQFDSSIGKTPFTFTLGGSEVIKGWDAGVVGMRVGGIRRLIVPPSLAYGATRSGLIPQNATLVFDIALLSIQQ
jgi:FKBP-type peptidyl-prolyl cis-trans isomerase FkpA